MSDKIIDAHMHIGLVGDRWPKWGKFSEEYRKSTVFKSFLTFVQVSAHEVKDETLHERTVKTIGESQVDQVVCLALDPIYDSAGKRREDLSHMWVANEYITDMLRPALPDRVLLGASVHPYDPEFESRTRDMVAAGAVLMKWLPSAQEFSIADHRVGEAMKFLATAKGGKPLPLLLHVGGEYAIPPHDDKNKSNDFLSWSFADGFWNWLRFGKAWYTPDIKGIHYNPQRAGGRGDDHLRPLRRAVFFGRHRAGSSGAFRFRRGRIVRQPQRAGRISRPLLCRHFGFRHPHARSLS